MRDRLRTVERDSYRLTARPKATSLASAAQTRRWFSTGQFLIYIGYSCTCDVRAGAMFHQKALNGMGLKDHCGADRPAHISKRTLFAYLHSGHSSQ
jgi:hypothetical protein